MSEQQAAGHTPGPWVTDAETVYARLSHAPGDEAPFTVDFAIARMCCGDEGAPLPYRPDDEREANARLIAAAPQLLAALRLLLDWHVELVGSGDCGKWGVEAEPQVIGARAAIAAATGSARS